MTGLEWLLVAVAVAAATEAGHDDGAGGGGCCLTGGGVGVASDGGGEQTHVAICGDQSGYDQGAGYGFWAEYSDGGGR